MRLTIAARKSDLARLQAYLVGSQLKKNYPKLELEYFFRESLGDKNEKDPLWQMPERGVFTEDFRAGLLAGEFDLVVHSWKDLPVEVRSGTKIAATLPRADARDLLLLPKQNFENIALARRLRVLSSSPRRAYNLREFLPKALPISDLQCEFLPVRGNVPTRIRKLFAGEGDALIVAKAAVDRLLAAEAEEFQDTRNALREWVDNCYWMALPLSQNPCAAAQGALAIEVSEENSQIAKILEQIHCPRTFVAVESERKILAGYGGGCHQKIGVYCESNDYGDIISLRGKTDAGEELEKFSVLPREHRAKTIRSYWPRPNEINQIFEREYFDNIRNPGGPLIVAKADALPESWQVSREQIVWTGGIKTWFALAKRGVWVNGSFDGLGEADPRLEVLSGTPILFTKLTHSEGNRGISATMLATYRLVPKKNIPDLRTQSHFFWMSGSQFLTALSAFPEIAMAEHASGPGHTHKTLLENLKNHKAISVYLSYEDWLKEMNV